MTDRVGFKIEFKINTVFIFIQNLEAIGHSRLLVTKRKWRPSRVPLEAITEIPSKSGSLLINCENLRAPRKKMLISILPARAWANQFYLSLLYPSNSFVIVESLHREFSNRTTDRILSTGRVVIRVSLFGRRKPIP